MSMDLLKGSGLPQNPLRHSFFIHAADRQTCYSEIRSGDAELLSAQLMQQI